MTGHEIRQIFLDYFAERGHRVVKSSPLLPANDPTLLFTNAGMNQFKDVFLGLDPSDYYKKEAIYFAWDLLVNHYQLDPQRLWFSVFAGDAEVPADEEAVRYWEQVGAP